MANHSVLAKSLDEVVARYLAEYASNEEREMSWFRRQPTLTETVRLAGLAERPFRKRFDHQRRIPAHTLQAFAAGLIAQLSRIAEASTFPELHDVVEDVGRSFGGIGELTVYDTTLRIGAKLGLEPDRVYLHAGTRAGARLLGLGKGRKWIPIDHLPDAFRQLSARQAEDCLCIFRESIRGLTTV